MKRWSEPTERVKYVRTTLDSIIACYKPLVYKVLNNSPLYDAAAPEKGRRLLETKI